MLRDRAGGKDAGRTGERPGPEPIGQKVAYDRNANPSPGEHNWYENVGIVGDQHRVSPGEPVQAELFENRNQDWNRINWLVFRTSAA